PAFADLADSPPNMSLFWARRLRLRRRHKTWYGFGRAGLMPSRVSGCVTQTPFSPGGQLASIPIRLGAERQWRSRVDRGQMIAGSKSLKIAAVTCSFTTVICGGIDGYTILDDHGSQYRRERCPSWQRTQRRDGPLDVLGLRSGGRQRSSEP